MISNEKFAVVLPHEKILVKSKDLNSGISFLVVVWIISQYIAIIENDPIFFFKTSFVLFIKEESDKFHIIKFAELSYEVTL